MSSLIAKFGNHVPKNCDPAHSAAYAAARKPEWLPDDVTPKQVTHGLRPLLERPVEHVLATHGGPRDRPALERALS